MLVNVMDSMIISIEKTSEVNECIEDVNSLSGVSTEPRKKKKKNKKKSMFDVSQIYFFFKKLSKMLLLLRILVLNRTCFS